jgi:molecular chaperone HtpG
VDEILVQWVFEFDGKHLKSVAKGLADIGDDRDLTAKGKELSSLMDVLQSKLDPHVRQVRLSGRLTSSPACLVVSDQDMSPNLEKMLNQAKGETSRQKRIMELNPDHDIVVKMGERLKQDAADPLLDDYANILYGYALLAEGSELDDSTAFNQALLRVLTKAI